jgi:S1-C subfamily serine protease
VKKGDIIVEFDGEKIRGSRQFTRIVQETPSGRKVQATVIRDGQRMTLTLEPRDTGAQWFGDWDGFRDFGRSFVIPAPPTPPATPEAPHPPSPPLPPKFFEFDELLGRSSGRLGVTVDDLSSQLAEYFGTKDGVLVTSVTEGSVASKAGLKAGDVITSVNGTDVTSPADLRRRLGRFGDSEEFTLGIVRDRKPMTLKGKLEAGSRRRLTYTVL